MKEKKLLALACAGTLLLSANALALPQTAGKGDPDGDGAVTAGDARFILRCAVSLEQCEAGSEAFRRSDVDGDGTLTADDARYVLRAAVGLTDIETLADVSYPETTAATEEVSTAAPTTRPAPESTTVSPYPLTSQGYEIRTVNGVTYVGGVLIANKTYGLPRSYGPGSLTAETYAAFQRMQKDASRLGLRLWVASGYRSYDHQSSIYNKYVRRDGKAAADRYSARPGHSEHQTGLAFDLNTITQSFAYTAEGKWVAANCWKYGFILRYPKNKEAVTGYMYEPWHLRYLGTDLAAKVYGSGLCLEEYLGIDSRYR